MCERSESASQTDTEEDHRLLVGSVVKVFIRVTTPPKYKRFVIVGHSDDGYIGVALIDSKLNNNVHRQERTKAFILPLEKNEERDHFLDHDSFVDCTTLHPFSKRLIREALNEDENAEYYGGISIGDLSKIRKAIVQNNHTIPFAVKAFFNLID